MTANLVDDEGYWQKCCKAKWDLCDISQHGNNWKRMFFEKTVEGKYQGSCHTNITKMSRSKLCLIKDFCVRLY